MIYYTISRLASLDIKWTYHYQVNWDFNNYPHSNPYYELILVSNGPVYLQAEDEYHTLQTGDLFLLTPWEKHMGWKSPEKSSSFYWVQFEALPAFSAPVDTSTKPIDSHNNLHGGEPDLRMSDKLHEDLLLIPRHFKTDFQYKLLGCFENLVYESKSGIGHYRYRMSLQLGSMLELISTNLLRQRDFHLPAPASYTLYRKLLNFLHEQYPYELTKETIEKTTNRRYEHISQVFKKHTGLTITAYINRLRIQRSKYLLINSETTVQEIAKEIGILDAFYYSKLFKRSEGVSPTQYRERNRAPGINDSIKGYRPK